MTVVVSSVPAVLDWLVAAIKALPACAAPVAVSDGFPSERSNSLVTVGVDERDAETDSTSTFGVLGGKSNDEQYKIPCLIACYGGGATAKTPRDAAFAIWNPIASMILTDPTLGGTLVGAAFAKVEAFRFYQTNVASEAGEGRDARIYFTIHVHNYFPPS
jgi:hypothetical protein